MTKHIKFEENIEGDDAYKKDFVLKKKFLEQSEYDDEDFDDGSNTVKWFDQSPEDPQDFKPVTSDQQNTLLQEARSIMHGESLAHETKMSKVGSSDQKWARSLLSKGAMADRVAAATVLIQDSPIHNLSTLEHLVSMVKPAKKKDSLITIETLTDLFVGDLLIPDRKLRKFEQRPLSELEKMCSGNKDHRRKILLHWIYEHLLKETYGEFVKALNTFAHDTIEAHKEKAITAMAKLLMGNPELENVLLTNIVNKLGDPSQKVASKVIYQLSQVLYNHPNMKNIVLNEIERMLFRPNISPKAQYYGICFLNQFYLNNDDSKVAENLVRVYFSFFKSCIKTGEVDSRLMSGILTGVRRCRPFLRDEAVQALQTHSHALHKMVHLASYTIALQALALLFQLGATDRYYNSLYKKLSHPETLTTTHPALLLGLVYRSLNNDECLPRVLAFLKRLLQLAILSDANRSCAILLVVARLSRRRKLPLSKEKQEEIVDEPKVEETEDIVENNVSIAESESNVAESDSDNKNKKSKKKKSTKEKDGGIDEEEKKGDEEGEIKSDVKTVIGSKHWLIGDKLDLLKDEDDEEVYHDIPLEEDRADHKRKLKNLMRKKKESSQGWLFHDTLQDNLIKQEEEDKKKEEDEDNEEGEKSRSKEKNLEILIKKSKNMSKVVDEYSPNNRNPMYCGAEHSVMTELLLLKEHYHPSVRLFAEKLLQGSSIQYNGDPLKDFSIAQFLDRFAFKNPKKNPLKAADQPEDSQQGVKIRGSHPKFAVRRNYTPGGIKSLRVNSAAYLNEDVSHIPVDERFLYDYLHMRKRQGGDTKEDESGAESDTGSVDSEDFNSYLDTLTGKNVKDESDDEEEEDDMNYMKEMMAHKKVETERKKNKRKEEAEEMDEDSDGEDDIADDLSSIDSADLDDGDSDLMFSDEDGGDMDDEEAKLESKITKSKQKGKKKKDDFGDFSDDDDDIIEPPVTKKSKAKGKGGKKGIESMFTTAEEFSTLLEETGSSKKQGTSQAVATNDNASTKQLNWEERRDRWVKGFSGNTRGRGRGGGRGGFGSRGGNNFSRGGGNFGRGGGSFSRGGNFSRGGSNFGRGGSRGGGYFSRGGSSSFDNKRKFGGGGRGGGPNKKFKN